MTDAWTSRLARTARHRFKEALNAADAMPTILDDSDPFDWHLTLLEEAISKFDKSPSAVTARELSGALRSTWFALAIRSNLNPSDTPTAVKKLAAMLRRAHQSNRNSDTFR